MRLLIVLCAASLFAAFAGCLIVTAQEDHSAVWQSINGHRKLSASADCRYSEQDDAAELKNGSLLIECKNKYCLQSMLANFTARGGSLIFVRALPDCEHVFLLLGRGTLTVGKHGIDLRAGEEAAVANHPLQLRDLTQNDSIGRRRMRMVKLDDGEALCVSEFSILQAAEREPDLYRLFHSRDPQDKSARERLLKTAAILNFVTGAHGPYTTGLR